MITLPMLSTNEIPLENFFKNPEKTGFQISPNGKKIAFMQPWNNRLNVFVKTIDGTDEVQVTKATERDIAGFFWANNEKIAFLQDKGGDENFSLYSVNTDGTSEKHLTPFENVLVHITDDLKNDDEHLLIEMNKRNPQIFDVYRINVNTGEMEMIAENPGNIVGWMTDHDGKLRIGYVTDGVTNKILFRKTETDPFEEIMTVSFKDSFNPVNFTYDNKKLFVISNLGRNTTGLYTFDPETKKQEELLYANDQFDLAGILGSEKQKKLLGVFYTEAKTIFHVVEKERETIQKELESKLPNLEVRIVDNDREEEKLIVKTFSDKTRGSFYLYETKTKKLSLLAEVSPWIEPEKMATMKPISYKSRDGLTINGYLTLPNGKENAKNLPVIINPHGGPWVRDTWRFNSEVQFLASRGYAILQMNYRGSTGYGREFWQASFKQWGKKMQDDISDGVQWLIDEGIADPKRVAIYGGSYGGYATLAGITFTPELYSCAVDYVGVSNLFTFFETFPPYWLPMRKMMEEMVGNPETEKEAFTATSPIFHIDKIRCPLFVAQGTNDPRVKKEHSDQIVNALKEKNIAVEYMVKDNEGHGFHNQENQFDFYRAMEKFFKTHL